VESLLFASNEPVSFQKLRDAIATYYPVTPPALREAITTLAASYEQQGRSFLLQEIAQGYVLRTRAPFAPYVEALCGEKRSEKLSPAANEVLAIIAYRQPITRPQIEALRGVECGGVIHTLLERQLISPAGKLEAPGRPTLFATTKYFLQHYGLHTINDLPSLQTFVE
jgi:segregation and condensation protein B